MAPLIPEGWARQNADRDADHRERSPQLAAAEVP
jgi:hypothetical protein